MKKSDEMLNPERNRVDLMFSNVSKVNGRKLQVLLDMLVEKFKKNINFQLQQK